MKKIKTLIIYTPLCMPPLMQVAKLMAPLVSTFESEQIN